MNMMKFISWKYNEITDNQNIFINFDSRIMEKLDNS